jgi:ParB family chromosome partitioning protein
LIKTVSINKKDKPYAKLRGVDLLLGEISEQQSPSAVFIPVRAIRVSPEQPRRYYDVEKQKQLVQSIKTHGILEPILVRPTEEDGGYTLVAGERRYRAALELELEEVPAVVKDLSDEESIQIALVENLLRADLNPVEETESMLLLLSLNLELPREEVLGLLHRMSNEKKGKTSTQNVLGNPLGQSVEEVFNSVGTVSWESFVSSRLPLLNLPENILIALREGKLEYTKAKAIAKVKDEEAGGQLLEEAIAQNLSLTQIRARVNELMAKVQEDSSPIQITPQREMTDIYQRLKKSELWKKEPQKWKKVQGWLKKIESLLEEESLQVVEVSGNDESTSHSEG